MSRDPKTCKYLHINIDTIPPTLLLHHVFRDFILFRARTTKITKHVLNVYGYEIFSEEIYPIGIRLLYLIRIPQRKRI